MSKIIAVVGGSGTQGGSVVRAMLKAGWHVRAITRNAETQTAKALEEAGAQITVANIDDSDSLDKAFTVCLSVPICLCRPLFQGIAVITPCFFRVAMLYMP
jgi:NAD(P)-dependent dehydrogenase (short-subunit alcohol dehydrogenase family)